MTYLFDWVGPYGPTAWDDVPLRTPEPYGEHLRPLYNLQQDVARIDDLATTEPVDQWKSLWLDLARSLAGRVERFALVAGDGGNLAGVLRFLPKRYSLPRAGAWDPSAHGRDPGNDVLWLGAATVDMRGYEERLPLHLLDHVIDEARRLGFKRLQALAWSDVPVYALWGQSFPWMVYEAAGFRRIAETDGSQLQALPDMIAGHHGGLVRDLASTQLESAGLTMAQAEAFAIVERCLS
ncbi:MAG TPA: hypothetical protein DGN59_01415 [Candidatus Latescibacteria bacterium]|nr:hypothetical protein [Candidatus Latescibacterota bacterium]